MPFGCALGSIVRECSLSVHEYHWSIVGQPGGTPRSGRGGRRFKSCHSDQHLGSSETSIPTVSPTDSRPCAFYCRRQLLANAAIAASSARSRAPRALSVPLSPLAHIHGRPRGPIVIRKKRPVLLGCTENGGHTKCKKTVPKRPRPPAKAKYATQGVRRTFYRLLFLDGDRIFRSCSQFGSLASSFKPPAVCLAGRCKSSPPVRA